MKRSPDTGRAVLRLIIQTRCEAVGLEVGGVAGGGNGEERRTLSIAKE